MDKAFKEQEILKIGDVLHASCSDEFYGEIIRIGEDENKQPVIDIIVNNANDLIDIDEDSQFPESQYALTNIELPEGVKIILRDLQYKLSPMDYEFERDSDESNQVSYLAPVHTYKSIGYSIVCRTPGNNCYRCTKLFSVMRKTTPAKPFQK